MALALKLSDHTADNHYLHLFWQSKPTQQLKHNRIHNKHVVKLLDVSEINMVFYQNYIADIQHSLKCICFFVTCHVLWSHILFQ